MKKIFLLLSIVSVFGLTSCNNDDNVDYVDYDTYPEVFETDPVNFIRDADGLYAVTVPLNPKILASDVVLVYRLAGTNNLGNDIWEPIPTDYDLDQGTLKYYFDFSQDEVVIYLVSSFDPVLRTDFSRNQYFRIVLVPGYVAQNLDTNNYDAVMSAIKEANNGSVQIKTIKQ